MPIVGSKEAVKAAYEYLKRLSPNSKSFSNFRLEEIQSGEHDDFLITLSYEVSGESGFDKKKEYKDFQIMKADGTITSMKIRKL